MTTQIDYYLSTSSPWTYLGSGRLMKIAEKSGAKVNVYPTAFHKVFEVSGGLPLPKRAPQRQAYRMMELKRWKAFLGLPIILEPENFPATAPASSLIIIAAREAGQDALTLSHKILSALWEDDRNIDEPDVLVDIADDMGLNGADLMAAANKPEIAALFEDDTKTAIEKNVFGAPSYVIDGEIFWGQDRIDFVARKLGVSL